MNQFEPGSNKSNAPFFSMIVPTVTRPVQRTHCPQFLGGSDMFFRHPEVEGREFCERWLRHGFRMTDILRAS
jgi:hypothetical protein